MEITKLKSNTLKNVYSYIIQSNKVNMVDRNSEIECYKNNKGIIIRNIELYSLYDYIKDDFLKNHFIKDKSKVTVNAQFYDQLTSYYRFFLARLENEFEFTVFIDKQIKTHIHKLYIKKKKKVDENFFLCDGVYITSEFNSYIKRISNKAKKNIKLKENEAYILSAFRNYFGINIDPRADLYWLATSKIVDNMSFMNVLVHNFRFIYYEHICNDTVSLKFIKEETDFMLFIYNFEYFFFNEVLKCSANVDLTIDKTFEVTLSILNDVLGINLIDSFNFNKYGIKEEVINPLLQHILFSYDHCMSCNCIETYDYDLMLESNTSLATCSTLFSINKLNQFLDGIIYLNRNITFENYDIKPIPLNYCPRDIRCNPFFE